jgi:hypothetical protein
MNSISRQTIIGTAMTPSSNWFIWTQFPMTSMVVIKVVTKTFGVN